MRLAYIASRYPHLSHTFIRREVEALRAEGVEVDTFSIRPSESGGHFGAAEREAERSTTTILPVRASTLLRAHLAALGRSPGAYVRTLAATVRSSPPGVRHRTWAVFYFVEGVVLWWHCQRRGIHHVHAHFANVGADVARAAARFGRAADAAGEWSWSFTMHGYTEFTDLTRWELPGKASDADAVVCISDYARSQLMLITDPERWPRFHMVHCGIDVGEFSPAPAPASDGPLRVLSVGRLVPEKGTLLAVEAVALLKARGVDVELTLAGDGPSRGAIEERAAELGVAEQVRLVGAVPPDEVVHLYQAADVFCLPSFAEGVPVVLMEAMACGVPVVATYITGVPELVTDGVEGFTITPGRADLVADALARLVDPGLRQRMGRAGRAKVEAGYDIAAVGPQLVEVFASIRPAAPDER